MASSNPIVRVFAFLWSGVDGLRKVLHLVLLLVIFSVLVGAIPGGVPESAKNAALMITPAGYLVDELQGDAFSRAIDELQGQAIPQTLVRDITEALERAANDDNVPAVVINTDSLYGGGLTKLEEIAKAMLSFQSSGKPIYAYGSFYSQEGYYLAAHADSVWLDPKGGIFLTGYGAFNNYFKDALDKLEIDWNVFRVGTYKSYAEPFLRNDMSEADREASSAWLGDLWGGYLAGVISARQIDAEAFLALSSKLDETLTASSSSWAELAVEKGLVDALKSRSERDAQFLALFGEGRDEVERFNGVSMEDYLTARRLLKPRPSVGDAVAVVVASGPVVDGEAPPGQIGGDSTARLIRKARLDDDVKALVLRVDSGGGSVFASDVIQDEILAFKATGRPLVASMGSVAASAGYWISASADQIFASPNTITGSIGVVGMFPTFNRTLEKLGVHTDGVGTTPLAGQFRADRALNDSARTIIQKMVEDDYDRFIGGVASYRGMEKSAVDKIAQGRVWSGADAYEIGLVDEFGDLDSALDSAAQLAGLNLGSYVVKYVRQDTSPLEAFVAEFTQMARRQGVGANSATAGRARVWSMLHDGLSYLGRFNDPKGVYAECFCTMY